MTPRELPRTAQIKTAIASASTCTTAILDELACLLTCDTSPDVQQNKLGNGGRGKKQNVLITRAPRGPGKRAKNIPEAAYLDIHHDTEERLQPREQFKLATEVVNVTLEALTEAIRIPTTRNNYPSTKPIGKSLSDSKPTTVPSTDAQDALQPRCINRLSKLPSGGRRSRRSSSSVSIRHAPGLLAQVECARLAFARLRSLNGQNGIELGMPHLQLETGMSAFIGKLISLGLDDLAIKELRILRKRLIVLSRPQVVKGAGGSSRLVDEEGKQDSTVRKETLADLLQFEHYVVPEQLLGLVTATQLQVLKLIASKKRPCTIEAAFGQLQPSVQYSPVKLLEKLASGELPGSREKAARQLETLVHTLLLLCPGVSSSEDAIAMDIRRSVSPELSLHIQLLALQTRFKWWNLCGHCGDGPRELLEPFAQCLRTFTRRSILDAAAKYKLARDVFMDFSVSLDIDTLARSSSKTSSHPPILSMYRSLADLAQMSQEIVEGVEWLRKSTALLAFVNGSQIRICATSCQMATLQLQAISANISGKALGAALQEAIETLNGDLRGDSADLDELLVILNSLRKVSFSVLVEASTQPEGSRTKVSGTILAQCSEIVLLSVTFLLRFVGTDPGSGPDSKPRIRFEQRQRLAHKVTRPTINSVVALARLPMACDISFWGKVDIGLRECSKLLSILENCEMINAISTQKQMSEQLPFVLLSNAYWSHFLQSKQNSSVHAELLYSLRTSIEMIKQRSNIEKSVGLLHIKLEKLGALFESSGELKKAMNSYAEALYTQMDLGILREAAVDAASSSLTQLLEKDGEFTILCRVLLAHSRMALRMVAKEEAVNVIFDDNQLPSSERGLLLEYQLTALKSLLSDRASTGHLRHLLQHLAESLLTVYTAAEYPIRRARVIVCLMGIESSHPSILKADSINQLFHDQHSQLLSPCRADAGLQRFATHLLACQDVCATFYADVPRVEDLEPILKTWTGMVQGCVDWRSLQDRVSSIPDWLAQLESVADYLDMQGRELERISILRILTTVLGLQTSIQAPRVVSNLASLGLQLIRHGRSAEAGLILQKAERHTELSDVPLPMLLQWQFAYAEYLVEIGNVDKCEECVGKAQSLLQSGTHSWSTGNNTIRERYNLVSMTGELNYVQSLLASARNQNQKALLYARKSVKLAYRAWAILECRNTKMAKSRITEHSENELETVTDTMGQLSLSPNHPMPVLSTKHESLRATTFWALVPHLFRRLVRLSELFAYFGMLQEAKYYVEQALKIGNAVSAKALQAQCHGLKGSYDIRSGQIEDGLAKLERAKGMISTEHSARLFASFQLSLADAYAAQGDGMQEEASLNLAREVIAKLMLSKPLDCPIQITSADGELDSKMQGLNMKDAPPKKGRPTKRTAVSRAANNIVPRTKLLESTCKNTSVTECQPLQQYQGRVLRKQVCSALWQKKTDQAALYLEEALNYPTTKQDFILQTLRGAEVLLRQGLEHMTGDPVFCVLPESTISCPSIASTGRRQSELIESIAKDCGNTLQATKPNTKQLPRSVNRKKAALSSHFSDLLCKAREGINSMLVMAQIACSSSTIHNISNIQGKLLMMLSAVSLSRAQSIVNPGFAIYVMELGRTMSILRETSAIRVERLLSVDQGPPEPTRNWSSNSCNGEFMDDSVDFATFQADYIDIIPAQWTVISLSLSDGYDELRIAKIRSGQTPFILTIPLNRHNSRDADEEIFGFNQGKAELLDVIGLANYSTHDARDMSRKGAKTEWWEARAALDTRLRDLLANIENIWLGGFRGIFAVQSPGHGLLSRFQQSFYRVLEKHLPSRQKQVKGNKNNRVALDPRVLELFVGLGDPNEADDMDEPLMDLLYFVVDILQFHGERNAYDEIDFDSIAIETLDALRHYHEAAREEAGNDDCNHTILVLDKALHCFPWESLPCLAGHSVSRVPSLGCLRDRILRQQQEKDHDHGPAGLYLNRNSGSYILNPAGDLTATQATFEKPLQALRGWSALVHREPNETEMQSNLESRDIFIYFGHGSGGQYIRSRTIKKLERCAVALLMGCSSGALTEAGEFEPYGTPMNYMHAGCPALLATLWDVTDKDIDRFSITVLEKWGLFGKQEEKATRGPSKRATKERGTGRMREDDGHGPAAISLDQAVAVGRESCILRYLNGAAPVVYGIPVFLS